MTASDFLPGILSRRNFLLLPLALILLATIVLASLQPQSIQWQEGQATGSFQVDRSAVLLPGTCVNVRWNVSGVNAVKLNGAAVDNAAGEPFCIEPNQAPTWATEAVGGFDRFHYLQVGVLIFRFDFWLLIVAAGLCLVGAAAPTTRFRRPLIPIIRRLATLRDHLFKPGTRIFSWLKLIGSAIQLFFLLRFLSFVGSEHGVAWVFSGLMLLIFWFINTRLADYVMGLAFRNILFPFALVTASELFRIMLQQWGSADSNPLLAEVHIWRGFLFIFLFLAWGAVYFNHQLSGVAFRKEIQPEQTAQNRLFNRIRFVGVATLCLSLIGFWAYVHIFNAAPTYGQNFSWDSEPSFFIDGLTVFIGERYAYIQHPDATTSMISSAVLALTYPFVNAHSDSFVMYHLQNPALFVAVARGLTTLLCCLCFVALAYLVIPVLRSWRDVLIALALPATMYALHPLSFETVTLWSHHTLGFAISILVLLCLLTVMRSKPKLRHLLAIALAAGLMTAGSFFYGPLAVGVIVTTTVYSGWKSHFKLTRTLFVGLIVSLTCVAGFLGGVSVITYSFAGMVSYAFAMLSHAGAYGYGDPTFISLDKAKHDFGNLLTNLPLMFVLLVAGSIILVSWARRNREKLTQQRGLWAFAIGLVCQILLALLLVTKMYNLYYALCVTAGVTVALALFLTLTDSSRILRWALVPVGVVILLGYGITFRNAVVDYGHTADNARNAQVATTAMLDHYANVVHKDVTQLRIALGYATYNDCYYLRFGNESYARVFTSRVDSLCPNEFLYSDQDNWEVYLRRYPPAYLFRDNPILVELFDQQANMELARNPKFVEH